MNTKDALQQMFEIIESVTDSEVTKTIMFNNLLLTLNTIKFVADTNNKKQFDVSDVISNIAALTGIDVEDIVQEIIDQYVTKQQTEQVLDKYLDADTVNFITGKKYDAYEQFLEENKTVADTINNLGSKLWDQSKQI